MVVKKKKKKHKVKLLLFAHMLETNICYLCILLYFSINILVREIACIYDFVFNSIHCLEDILRTDGKDINACKTKKYKLLQI